MPNSLHVSKVRTLPIWPADIFICSGSFEDRCKIIPTAIGLDDFKKCMIVENDNIVQVRENSKFLSAHFKDNAIHAKTNTTDPIVTADILNTTLTSLLREKTKSNVVVDITTFTHECLLILLRILNIHNDKIGKLHLLYSSALDYSVGQTIENKWLSRGVANVRTILGYPGSFSPTSKTHLILFVGYEHQRASKLIELIEPNIISLGYGKPGTATNEKHEEVSQYSHDVVARLALKYSHVQSFPFACNDHKSAEEAINGQFSKFPEYNTIVAPMNTKLSTVGTYMAAIANEKIQLCYSPAVQYNFDNYSRPSDLFYHLQLVG